MPDLGATLSHIKYNPSITAAATTTVKNIRSQNHPIQKVNRLINIKYL